MADDAITEQLAALAHPARLDILKHLSAADTCNCGDVVRVLPYAQSTVSQHLRVLQEAGLVTRERDGQRSRYALDRAALRLLSQQFEQIIDQCCSEKCCVAASGTRDND
ncbi:ArsR/SmtB family transcription factor [Oricola sp.]|uniref:ArsR/SmtB family transcription factor n=1 Tax=Oricola sp. TaxID=1979950 RepID=UPI003BA926E6